MNKMKNNFTAKHNTVKNKHGQVVVICPILENPKVDRSIVVDAADSLANRIAELLSKG